MGNQQVNVGWLADSSIFLATSTASHSKLMKKNNNKGFFFGGGVEALQVKMHAIVCYLGM